MRDYKDINLNNTEKMIAHLYDIEIAVMYVMETVVANTTNRIKVNSINKCWIGTDANNTMTLSVRNGNDYKYFSVIDIDYLSNTLIVSENVDITIIKDTTIFETLNNYTPYLTYGVNTYLDMYQSCFGAQDGYMHFSDFDIPIVTVVDGKITPYIPFPIEYNEVTANTTGKVADVTLTIANVNQMISSFVLLRAGLRKNRKVKIHTCHIAQDSYTRKHINIPVTYNSNNYYICKTNQDRSLNVELNNMLTYLYVPANYTICEFVGETKTISMSEESVVFTLFNTIDDNSDLLIPKRLYTRTRCQFRFKGEQCRFNNNNSRLKSNISSSDTTLTMTGLYLYLQEASDDMIIQIDSELMKIKKANKKTYPKEADRYYTVESYTILTRGYGGTTAASHTINTPVSVTYCKKTEQDCIARCNMVYYGSFPAIPKSTGEGNGVVQ